LDLIFETKPYPHISHPPPAGAKESDLEELRGTAALDKMEGVVQSPADAPTRVRIPPHPSAT